MASLSIMLLLCVLGFTILLGSWLKSRGVTWLHQAGAALLLGMAGGLALVVPRPRWQKSSVHSCVDC